jgi:hypothetical protein
MYSVIFYSRPVTFRAPLFFDIFHVFALVFSPREEAQLGGIAS